MPRFTKGDLTIETAVATEAAELRRDGFVEQKDKAAEVKASDSAKAVNGTPAGDASRAQSTK